MKIALVQRNPTVGDTGGNVDLLLAGVAEAARAGADLAVCSELAIPGYPPRDLLERASFIDDNLRGLERFAREAAIPAVVGFVDRARQPAIGRGIHNAAAVTEGGRVASVHHKSLLPTYDVFDEWRYFEPATGLELARVGGISLGISICEDIWNAADFWPERRYRTDPIDELVLAGAQVLINISASPFTVPKRPLRPRMLAAAAARHRRPLIMVNQVGGNDDLVFDGSSMALAADGTIAARARELAEDLIVVDVDPLSGTIAGPMREVPAAGPAGDSEAALAALVLGTRDYVHKSGFTSAIVGLSGGIDSALTAAIAARALGPANVVGVAMPSRYSSEHSKSDAAALAEALGIELLTVPIERPHAAFLDLLAPSFAGTAPGIAEENIQSRCRAVIIMALSNKLGHLPLTTGNKSELAVGYCTLYGDMAGGLAPISDVPKTMVYQLARCVNRLAGTEVIPASTLTKPPSAELRPDQRDDDSLPPYDVLDPILELYIEEDRSRAEIIEAGHDERIVDRVIKLVRTSEFKRRQAAPGLKIRARAFGPGRRMPLAAR